MFMGLSMRDKLSVFTEAVTVTEGKEFYRIRKIDGIKDPNDAREWDPVPAELAKQGRFNRNHESVLYVASSPDSLEREVRLLEEEEYYLAKYTCNKTFEVGSFLALNNPVNTLIHRITMAVSGSEELTEKENILIDDYYRVAKNKDLYGISLDLLASLYIHKELPNLYDTTNKLAKLVLKKHEYGIRYSSVYAPIELSGAHHIVTLDGVECGNYVLTQSGSEHIELVSVEKKIAGKPQGLERMIEVFSRTEMMDLT